LSPHLVRRSEMPRSLQKRTSFRLRVLSVSALVLVSEISCYRLEGIDAVTDDDRGYVGTGSVAGTDSRAHGGEAGCSDCDAVPDTDTPGDTTGEQRSVEIDPMIVAGDLFTCALDSAGRIHCWGYLFSSCAPLLTEPCELLTAPEGRFVEISAAGIAPNLCGLLAGGEVECIGEYGTETLVPSGTFRQASAGYSHACAIRPDDTVECWSTWYEPPAERFLDLSSGDDHSCGRTLDNTLACFGKGTETATPEQCRATGNCGQSLPPDGEFLQLTTGWTNSCALRTDGSIACWGSDTDGRSTPPTGSFKRLARTHSYSNCAIREDDSLACWGNGFHQFQADGPFKDVAVGSQHACALTPDNEIVCWGERLGGCEGCDAHLPPEGLTL
jgi:alpha-tubulin suppressor-like RCC1 family protein